MNDLLDLSKVLIYGRIMDGLEVKPSDNHLISKTNNNFLLNQLNAWKKGEGDTKEPMAKIAIVYGFEFEGHYYDLPAPTMFMVHGDPISPEEAGAAVESKPKLACDIKVWVYDKADYSLRLDIESGPIEEILLDATIETNSVAAQSSAKRMSGKRVSGKRMSGD